MLSLDNESNALARLHAALLPRLRVMKNFHIVMRSIPAFLGGLNLQRLEVEAIAQALYHFTSLYSSETPTQLLLKTLIEYHQLEIGIDEQIFSLGVESYHILSTHAWITSL